MEYTKGDHIDGTLFDLMNGELQLRSRFREIESLIMEADGEVDDELDQKFNELLDLILETDEAVEDKIDSYGFVMSELESDIEGLKGREKPVKALAKSLRNRRKGLERSRSKMKDRIHDFLRSLNKDRIEGDHYRFRRQANGGRRSIDVSDTASDPEDMPSAFTQVSYDMSEIREGLKEIERVKERIQDHEEQMDEIEAKAKECDDDDDIARLRAEYKSVQDASHAFLEKLEYLEDTLSGFSFEERGEHVRKY